MNRQRLRIAHLIFSLDPGGLENGVVNIANGLDRERFETWIGCLETSGQFAERLNGRIHVHSFQKDPGLSISAIFQLAKWIREIRPDVIHTHNLGPLFYGWLARIVAFSSVPVLHGEHGTFRCEDLTSKRLWMRKLLYRYCGRVHTVSESLKQYLVELGFPKHKITTVLNGVDCERFRPVRERSHLRQAIGIPEDAFVLGMVGRLIVSKRHEMVLEALDRLVAEHSEVFLLVVGDGGDHREAILRAMETHHYRDHILWVGHQADPAPYYQCMDLLVMPSSVEGLSNALLESMACAVPCLAHPACGASEVVEDGVDGYLREMDSDSDLAAELIRILENRVGVEEIGRNARKTAKENFSLEKMVNGYADLYRDVAARRLEASGL